MRKYLKPKTRNKLDWRQAVETRSKRKADPFLTFLHRHVSDLYGQLRSIESGHEKARTAVSAIVRSGPEGYPEELYEAYVLLKEEISPAEVEEVIALWHSQRERFEKNYGAPHGIDPPKMFWPVQASTSPRRCGPVPIQKLLLTLEDSNHPSKNLKNQLSTFCPETDLI